jgi:hypothetical protein
MKLGDIATDKYTGFTGVVMGRAEYLTGCTQFLLVPKGLTAEGKPIGGEWFDDSRIEGIVSDAGKGGISGGDRAPRAA